jgi:hypothetical protein
MRVKKFISLLIMVAGVGYFSVHAQTHTVDVDKLTDELQKSSPGKDELTMVWWVPNDFWRVTLQQEKVAASRIEEFLSVLRPYMIVVVADGKMNASGKASFRSEADIRNHTRIIDAQGTEYSALPKDQVGPGAKSVLEVMQPILSNVLGQFGNNFHFLVFPGLNSKKEPIADARTAGVFRVRLERGREFVWSLPLTSLLPEKKCPVDGQKMRGDWRYCPFHGAELKP